MPVSLGATHWAVRRAAREFAENELEPIALAYEKATEIYDGTSEIQRNVIAVEILDG